MDIVNFCKENSENGTKCLFECIFIGRKGNYKIFPGLK